MILNIKQRQKLLFVNLSTSATEQWDSRMPVKYGGLDVEKMLNISH